MGCFEMLKVVICCSQGASSSFLVGRLNTYIKQNNLDMSVREATTDVIMTGGVEFDVLLVAPQIRGQVTKLQESFPDKAVGNIEFRLYSGMQPKAVVDFARRLAAEKG